MNALLPSLAEASAFATSGSSNHPFIDGNKRVGHAAIEIFLVLSGHELHADVGEQERLILGVAAGEIGRERLTEWIKDHTEAG
jgi:death-on-curing protein